jgi:16S rRNA (guanine966-N2)-methyltransferase
VDSSRAALAQVTAQLKMLDAVSSGSCHPVSAQQFLQVATEPFDIVFIDPPFSQQLVQPVCDVLAQRHLVHKGSLVYVESGATESAPLVPAGWSLHREKISGGVAYRLFTIGSTEV